MLNFSVIRGWIRLKYLAYTPLESGLSEDTLIFHLTPVLTTILLLQNSRCRRSLLSSKTTSNKTIKAFIQWKAKREEGRMKARRGEGKGNKVKSKGREERRGRIQEPMKKTHSLSC